jgi:HlyD family secretion protein
MPLFPPEILNFTTQAHHTRTHSKTWIVYLIVLVAITAAITSLPFIKVQVSTQSRGIIRTKFENNQLQSAFYDKEPYNKITRQQK